MNQTHNWQFPAAWKMTRAAFDGGGSRQSFCEDFLMGPPTPPQTVDIGVGGNTNTREISEVTKCP